MDNVTECKIIAMAKKMASKYRASPALKDDLVQEGIMACLKNYSKYDPEKYNNKPEKYFYFKAKFAMYEYYKRGQRLITPPTLNQQRKLKSLAGKGSLEELKALTGSIMVAYDFSDESCVLTASDDQARDYEIKQRGEFIFNIPSDTLTEMELKVLSMRYMSGEDEVISYREVAKLLTEGGNPISHEYVKQYEDSAIKRLRSALAD